MPPIGLEMPCDRAPQIIEKILSKSLFEADHAPHAPVAAQSPAHPVLNLFRLTDLQLMDIFQYTMRHETNPEAVCQWAVDNIDYMRSFIPESYPRTIEVETQHMGAMAIVATTFGSVGMAMALGTIAMVHHHRDRRVMRVSQVEFLYILLGGIILVTVGSVFMSATVPPTNASCIVTTWLVNCGYTCELVPLIVKVGAINRLMSAAKRMRRVTLKRGSLCGTVVVLLVVVVAFLTAWSVVDPPVPKADYQLQEKSLTRLNETIVKVEYYCSSESSTWQTLAFGWHAFLLFVATVLAFQMRGIRSDFNESATLAIMIYGHFFFVLLRLAVFLLSSATAISNTMLSNVTSLIFSLDTIATIVIYFIPKFFLSDNAAVSSTRQSLSGVSSRFSMRQSVPRMSDSIEDKSGKLPVQPEESAHVEGKDDNVNDNDETQFLRSMCKSTIQAGRNIKEEIAEGDMLPVFSIEQRQDG